MTVPPGTGHSARAVITYGREDSLDSTPMFWNYLLNALLKVPGWSWTVHLSGTHYSNMICISLLNLTSHEQLSTEELPRFPPSPGSMYNSTQ